MKSKRDVGRTSRVESDLPQSIVISLQCPNLKLAVI